VLERQVSAKRSTRGKGVYFKEGDSKRVAGSQTDNIFPGAFNKLNTEGYENFGVLERVGTLPRIKFFGQLCRLIGKII
jgi:hypothetical protein